ncbi:hypothetical protein LH51_15775, partial [Nitrincola sp. A-D6]|uniref:hypothetical protein n=1 Tax=Nitrincola sp. A-D6 TaxID=1545442 RepID=UPI00051FF045
MSLPPPQLISNPTESPEVIEVMNLSITRIDDDTIEIPSFVSDILNAWFKLIFFALILGLGPSYDPGWFTSDGEPGVAYAAIYKMFNREESIKSAFLRYEDENNPGFTYSGRDYEEFKAGQINRHGRGIVAGLFFIGIIVIPWFLLNIAVGNPYRIDRKRRIIYTWMRGHFVCVHFPPGMSDPLQVIEAHVPRGKQANDPYNMSGPLNIWLPLPYKQKNGLLSIGASCFLNGAMVKYQSYYLRDFLTDYLTNPNPRWLDQLGPKRKPKHVQWYDYLFYRL